MGKVTAITATGAAAALALLAAAGCANGGHHHSSERIGPSPRVSPSSPAGGSGLAHSSPGATGPGARAGAGSGCAGAGSVTVRGASIPAGVPALDAVQFVSATHGWAAGSEGILATADGGRTWQRQYAGPARLYELDFTDAAHGWALGASGLLATSDGGRSWTALPEPCGASPASGPGPASGLIDSVHFVTPRLGYAVAGAPAVSIAAGTPVASGGGRLLASSDGGRTWNPVTGAPAAAQSACFTSRSTGFLGTPGRVWRTTDGGAHWSASFTEPPAAAGRQAGSPPDATALECAGQSAAWTLFLGSGAILGHEPYLAYATQDGTSWHVLFEQSFTESVIRPEVHAPDGPGSYPGPFSAIGPGSAAYVGWTPPMGLGAAPLELVSGGTRLARAGDVGGVTQPYAAAFVTPGRGWVVGADQTSPSQPGRDVITRTADGGRSWTRQYTAP